MTAPASPIRGLVAVPVYNEAENLPAVIAKLKGRIPITSLLFVDDGSADGSAEILEREGVRYLRHAINLGYEEALRTAMREVLENEYEYVVFFDSDGQHQVDDLLRIIHVHETEGFELVQGSRYQGESRIGLSLRSLGTRGFAWLTTVVAGIKITDVTCGLKLISRRFIPVALRLPTEDMHAELIVGLARCGARIHEEKITVTPREAGESMYRFYKGMFYAPKTIICLLGELLFSRQLKTSVGPPAVEKRRVPEGAPGGEPS